MLNLAYAVMSVTESFEKIEIIVEANVTSTNNEFNATVVKSTSRTSMSNYESFIESRMCGVCVHTLGICEISNKNR